MVLEGQGGTINPFGHSRAAAHHAKLLAIEEIRRAAVVRHPHHAVACTREESVQLEASLNCSLK